MFRSNVALARPRLRPFAAARRAARWAGVAVAAGLASPAWADNWLNPAGGNWADGTNWSEGRPPGSNGASGTAYFALGSQAGYTIINSGSAWAPVSVTNDNVTFVGIGVGTTYYSPLMINASAGGSSSVTVQSGTLLCTNGGIYIGSSGTTTLNLVQSTVQIDVGGQGGGSISVGGPAGSVTNYNQVGGTTEQTNTNSGGVNFGGDGAVNVNVTGGTIGAYFDAITFGGKGGVSATLNSTTLDAAIFNGGLAGISFGTDGGRVSAIDTNGVLRSGRNIDIGCWSEFGIHRATNGASTGEGPGVPLLTGGGTADLTLSGCNTSSFGLFIGGSGGNGTVLAGSQSHLQGSQIAIGYANGSGVLQLSSGAILTEPGSGLFYSLAYVGGSGGHGTVNVSGTGTNWNCSQTTIYIGYDGTANGVGVVALDHRATLIDVTSGGDGMYPIGLNLSSGGTLSVLSGARVNVPTLLEVPGSTLIVGLDGPSAADNGQINLTGTAVFAGTLNIVFENGYQPAVGQAFQLFTFGSESGQFSAINVPPGYAVDTSRLYSTGGVTVTAVPEPTAAWNASALIALGRCRRRRAR